MAQMMGENGLTEVELPPSSEVVKIVLDNGQIIDVKYGTYQEFRPVERGGAVIYMLRPGNDIDRVMVGFTTHIIATYYHSPWTPE